MAARATRRRPRSQAGTSFLELLVAAMLLAIISVSVMKLGAELQRGTMRLTARARSVGELRAAAEMILQDLGGASQVSWMDDDRLHIERVQELAEWQGAWAPFVGDAGIQYELEEQGLMRTDLALGSSILVAREIDAFSVDKVTTLGLIVTEVHVELRSGAGQAERALTLVWEN